MTYTAKDSKCDDKSLSTKDDVCDGSGKCDGTPYTCTPAHCEETSVPDGAACDNAFATTKNDVCDGKGACTCTPYTCLPLACQLSSTPNGVDCDIVPAVDGAPCDDGFKCTTDSCLSGSCQGTPVACQKCAPGSGCDTFTYTYGPEISCSEACFPDESHNVSPLVYSKGSLNDGKLGVDDWAVDLGAGASAEWMGWKGKQPVLTFDFGVVRNFTTVVLGMQGDNTSGVFQPTTVTVSFSSDGLEFTGERVFTKEQKTLPTVPYGARDDVVLGIGDSSGRYVRVTLQGPTDTWILLDEVAFGVPDATIDSATCDDPNGTCNETTGQCEYKAKMLGADCDDGNGCTANDACGEGGCTGTPVSIDDDNACTYDLCILATGAITHAPLQDGTGCTDGNACTVEDTCQAGECSSGSPVTCLSGEDVTTTVIPATWDRSNEENSIVFGTEEKFAPLATVQAALALAYR